MDESCTVYKTADFIGKRWTLLIILEIYKSDKNKKRYSELKNSLLKITPKILSLRLKELEKIGIIKKTTDIANFPVKCEYSLTKIGLEFIPIIKDIKSWALKNKFNKKNCSETNCRFCEI